MEPKSRHVDMGALDQIAAEDVKIQTPYATNLETWMAIEAVSKATGYGLSISRKFPTQEGYGSSGESHGKWISSRGSLEESTTLFLLPD